MVYRLFVERKMQFAQEAGALLSDLREVLGLAGVVGVRIFNRYDVENIEKALFDECRQTVFSEAATDALFEALPDDGDWTLAVEYLPGQYDQRSDAAEQCVQLVSRGERPTVKTARVYVFYGAISDGDRAAIRRHLINPVECREASPELPKTLHMKQAEPESPKTLAGFSKLGDGELEALIKEYGLAMDGADLRLCREYFASEGRDPSVTELKVLDTYWSDHCRHTTFNTELSSISFEDPAAEKAYERYMALRAELKIKKPVTLMDMATIGAKYLRSTGKLDKLDDSPEINACTVKITADVSGKKEDWLLLFKNETHNHPTEIEPFGGAATCLGGAIRDPLSGRAYVYQAMRLTGAGDPRKPISEALPGKLPQRRIVSSAAAGYSSYGNQIGLATGLVDEVYHPGYEAKRMEIGAVVGAAPAKNVRREEPAPGDVVLLIGGRTGRDGCGGATGSSKAHTLSSLESCGAEVQKGNAPEERKLQRLFRNPAASRLIKRCNDFGAGGVSVAIGELADGLEINLDAVPKKYEGLNATELAISESQERMAVVVEADKADEFIALARGENLTATRVAIVTASPRLVMKCRGRAVVDMSREFLNTNGASRSTKVEIAAPRKAAAKKSESFGEALKKAVSSLNVCSKRGLVERFDSTVGAMSVMMPLSGERQRTPMQAMAAKLPVLNGETNTCSVMAWGFDPYISEASPYRGAYLAVIESVAKLAAAGAPLDECYLSFQEYFPKPKDDARRWGLPAAALLGSLMAQLDLGVAAIGGKDSMSGSFEALDVPPTLVSFAIAKAEANKLVSPDFKRAGSSVVLLEPEYDENGLPVPASQKAVFARVHELVSSGKALSVYTPAMGGIAPAVFKMAIGNGLGFEFSNDVEPGALFSNGRGAFIIELSGGTDTGAPLGKVIKEKELRYRGESVALSELEREYEAVLDGVYPAKKAGGESGPAPEISYRASSYPSPRAAVARPRVLIPVFPGTNCEVESAAYAERAGAEAITMVLDTRNAAGVRESVERFAKLLASSQMMFIPGGFSGGDEPDGSGRFITAFLRSGAIAEELTRLLDERDGLVLGVCNGFQALIKLGLVPYGKLTPPDEHAPTLTFNSIGRHQSRIVRTRIASNRSPWLMKADPETIYAAPISHGEGRFICDEAMFGALAENGQVATQYVDAEGRASMAIDFNPASSMFALEGLTSPDGRVFGKMGHSERTGKNLYRNVPGEYDMKLFESAVEYFK